VIVAAIAAAADANDHRATG